jgi:hypothetical protein
MVRRVGSKLGVFSPLGLSPVQKIYPGSGTGTGTFRKMRPGYLLTAVAAFALLFPAGSWAQGGSLPSEGSALDQYVESIPDGEGGRPSNDLAGGGGGDSSSGPSVGGGLSALGGDGAAAARLAAATAPRGGGSVSGQSSGSAGSSDSGDGTGSGGSGGSGGSESTPSSGDAGFALSDVGASGDETAGDAVSSLLGSESDSDGLGGALPAILLATLLAALTAAVLRFRRSRRGEKTL